MLAHHMHAAAPADSELCSLYFSTVLLLLAVAVPLDYYTRTDLRTHAV